MNKIKELKEKNKLLQEENKKLRDENDSLWGMLDEITKSDVENYTHLLKELESDFITRALMITNKKVDA